MIIRVQNECRAVPFVEPGERMQFKMPLVAVFGVETEDSPEAGARPVEGLEMVQLRRSGVDDFANDRRCARIIAARSRAGAVHSHVRMHIVIPGNIGVGKNVLPEATAVGRVLRIGQRRDGDGIGLPKQRHLRDLAAGKSDGSVPPGGESRRAKENR
jgi:hypothetical protein